jgi:thioredoxin reductase (NADPH)
MADQKERIVIIGSGPAGWTAAIYAARANLSPLVIEGAGSRTMIPGGQLMFTTDVENYPGFPNGVTGPEMMMAFKEQAERFDTRVLTEDVVEIDLAAQPKVMKTSGGREIEADAVIVATGANAKWLGVPGEEKLARMGGGVSACAVCDGALPAFRDAKVAVVGGGDSAMEEAIYLTNFASEVFIIHRRDEFRASPIMAERALNNDKITVLWNTVVTEVHGEEFVERLSLEDTVTGETSSLEVGGLFVAIGHEPNVAFLDGQLPTDAAGYVELPNPGRMATGIPGVFVAGDVTDDYYRQAITAAGMGCMAALEAERWMALELDPSPIESVAAE